MNILDMKISLVNFIAIVGIFLIIGFSTANAGDLTSPLTTLPLIINSYFDHTSPGYNANNQPIISNNITIYNGTTSVPTNGSCGSLFGTSVAYYTGVNSTGQCIWYDGHNGIDYQAANNTPVIATAQAAVQESQFSLCSGEYIRLWHSNLGYSTIYVHLSQRLVATSTPVTRGQQIAFSGGTGTCSTAPHLHFGVRTGSSGGQPIDPYGWSGTGADPWPYNLGYLWTSYPPSLTVNPSLPTTTISGTLTSATWVPGSVYVLTGTVTVPAGVTLTLIPGTIVKFATQTSALVVNGTLNVQGIQANKIHFTSIHDDTVGGDTNGNGALTAPAAGNYDAVRFNVGSAGNISHATFRYGGYGSAPGAIENQNGTVTIANTTFSNNAGAGVYQANGGIVFTANQFSTNGLYGVSVANGAVNLFGNTFSGGHTNADAFIAAIVDFRQGGNFGNGSGKHGFLMGAGTFPPNQIWNPGIPYILAPIPPSTTAPLFTVGAGRTLTVNPGTVVKLSNTASVDVFGTLQVQGNLYTPYTSTAVISGGTSRIPSPPQLVYTQTSAPIYFTSYKDDTVAGDSNGNGAATAPTPGDYGSINLQIGSQSVFDRAMMRYGGGVTGFTSPFFVNGAIRNLGGVAGIMNSQFISNAYGDYLQTGGNVNILNTQFLGDSSARLGVYATSSAGVTLTGSTFANHLDGDILVSGGTLLSQSGNTSSGPGKHGILRYGPLGNSETWFAGIPYVLPNGFAISSGKTLQVMPSTVIKSISIMSLNPPAGIFVWGNLIAQGSGSIPNGRVYFTSYVDDAVGGDTNGDGSATLPAPASWNGMRLMTGSNTTISYAVIRYGGGFNGTFFTPNALWNGGGNLTLSNTKITLSNTGYAHSGGTVTASQNSISGNAFEGAVNVAGASINLSNTWWGSASGPNHPTLNAGGTGNSVSNNITFSPWLTSDPN